MSQPRIETAMPSALTLLKQGVRSETGFYAPRQRGEALSTATGDLLYISERSVTPEATTYEDVLRLDIGAGATALQRVDGQPDRGWQGYRYETQPRIDPKQPLATGAYARPEHESTVEQLAATGYDTVIDDDGNIAVQDAYGLDVSVQPAEEAS